MPPEWIIAPPLNWLNTATGLFAGAIKGSDFWRKTHYGFIHHNGHLYAEPVTRDFTMQVTFDGNYKNEYDQAGLMVWLDETTWLKTGIEFTEGRYFASAVVTRDTSDWSVAPLDEYRGALTIRLIREGGSFQSHYRQNANQPWTLLRVTYLTDAPTLQAGRMLCAPSGDGFTATFMDFSITPNSTDQGKS